MRKLGIWMGTIAVVLQAGAASLSGSRPNLILVMTDDQGMGDLSCMGSDLVKTPNLDRFHGLSTRFTEFHVSPSCSPTRAALMSGCYPFNVGVTHTILQRERMKLGIFTLPQALKSAGYATGIFGKWHLGDEEPYLPGNRGFDEALIHGCGGIGQGGDFPANKEQRYFDNVLLHNETVVKTPGFCTDLFFKAALGWIQKQEQSGQPYFAYVAPNAPHAPLIAPEKYKRRFLELGFDAATAARFGMIENIDDNFGVLMRKLDEWDAWENTVVIFTTDNGANYLTGKRNGERFSYFNAGLRSGKGSPYEGGNHVPMIMRWDGVLGAGVDINGLVAHVDLYQTFCDLAGVKLPQTMQALDGRSFLPLLENPAAPWPDRMLFTHCGRWPTGERDAYAFNKCAVRTQRWRLVNGAQLFDIENDPGERNDVASSFPEVVERLRAAYGEWWNSTLPKMVNEGLSATPPEKQPYKLRYESQQKEQGVPEWSP
ncbi:arylsulfatase [Pontiella sp.]|uniref:arylsulfatase n=1 Tax=Pontiella sp. TaxID=2837462 RepID=UPI00356A65EB